MTRSILFYGDSNTYGYDPADFYENRYPEEKRWTAILQDLLGTGWNVIPQGLNGRQIPNLRYDRHRIEKYLETLKEDDIFAVMLGTNDILLTMPPDAEKPVRKMREFLTFLTERKDASHILLISPVYIGSDPIRDPLFREYHEESRRMNKGFRFLADSFGTLYLDAASGGVRLSADQVHFSEEGHRRFAEMTGTYLQERWS